MSLCQNKYVTNNRGEAFLVGEGGGAVRIPPWCRSGLIEHQRRARHKRGVSESVQLDNKEGEHLLCATISHPRRITGAVLRYLSSHGDPDGSETPLASSSEGKNGSQFSERIQTAGAGSQSVTGSSSTGNVGPPFANHLCEGLVLFSLESAAAVDRPPRFSPPTFSCCGLNPVIGSGTCALLITTKLKN